MTKFKFLLPAALCAALCGCAAFTSGDLKVDKEMAQEMLDDRSVTPFAEIQLDWKNYPYRAPSEHVADGSTIDEHGKFRAAVIKPLPVPPADRAALLKRARKVFGQAGLYDRKKGGGTLRLTLTSMNRWTYGELFRSYFVETGFIFLLPSSLPVNYLLDADFETSTGPAHVELLGRNNTTFHLLLAPLYPFLAPGSGEKSLMNQMLWRASTDVYGALRRAAAAPRPQPKPAPAAQAAPSPAPAPAPEPEMPAETLVEPPEAAEPVPGGLAPAREQIQEQGEELIIGEGLDAAEPEAAPQAAPAAAPAEKPVPQAAPAAAPAAEPSVQPAVPAPATERPVPPAEETPDD